MPKGHPERLLRRATGNPSGMSGPTEAGEDQVIEVQYTLEDEVLIIEHLDHPPEDFGEALARTLQAEDAADGKRQLEAGLGGTSASVQRVSRRPR
jgi:hypothetical protein